jgi:hypothetical protein
LPLIRWQHWFMGNRDGGEDFEAARVDEGRCPYVEDSRARESKNDGDCAQAQAELHRNAAKGIGSWCVIQSGSREEKSVKEYRLELISPVSRDHPFWGVAEIAETCWVQADNPAEARRRVAGVMRLRKVILNQPNPSPSPWQDKQLTNCVLDNSKGNQLKPGEIITATGGRYQT